ncbi:MAG: DNA-processing protein DprA [Wolinella sp.]
MKLPALPSALLALKNPPKELFYEGDICLLDSPKVAIVGTRNPNSYAKSCTKELARFFTQKGVVVVSGGALGTDMIAHDVAFPRTILVSPSSFDRPYPPSHASKIKNIAKEGLFLSEYERDFSPMRHTFLERNRLIIALSDVVIIPQADLQSGSMQSARLAQKLGKPLYVLPHRLGESLGTQELLKTAKASMIMDFEEIIKAHFPRCILEESEQKIAGDSSNELLEFCATRPALNEALARFGEQIFEYEFEGKIVIEYGVVRLA